MPSLGPSLKIGRDIFDSGPPPVPPFDGVLFANGGFETDIVGWLHNGGVFSWSAAAGGGVNAAAVSANNVFYQNITLAAGTYRLTCGGSTVGGLWLAGDTQTGIPIETPYEFVVDIETAVSNGVYAIDGSPDYFFDNLKLELVTPPPADAVTYNGMLVTVNGEIVTHTE